VSMEVETCSYDTSMMSVLGDKGLSSFAFEMEMDDPEGDSQAEYMPVVLPPDEYSSICTIQMLQMLQRLCSLSDRLSLFCEENVDGYSTSSDSKTSQPSSTLLS